MPPLRKMQTSAFWSSGPPCAATLLASLRLSSVLRIADEPTAAQLSCFRNPRREMGLWIVLTLFMQRVPKHQTPNTKHQRTPNIQKPRLQSLGGNPLEVGAWNFYGVWCLDFGVSS